VKPRILVVEDNHTNHELLCDWLEVEGYSFVTGADLKGSFEELTKQPPDAVLLDINLGAEDWLTFVEWTRQKPELRETPVIAVTAHALAAERERLLNGGCKACLSKPIGFQALREEVRRR
jgi:two-component system cell cycle response regulator DivK